MPLRKCSYTLRGFGRCTLAPAGALCGYFEHQRRVFFEGCVADPLQTVTDILSGSKWSVLLSRHVMPMSDVLKVYPQLNLKMYVYEPKFHFLVKEVGSLAR